MTDKIVTTDERKVVSAFHRIHATGEVETPFSGSIRDVFSVADESASFLLLLVGVPPEEAVEGDELRVVVNDAVHFSAPVSWLMDFYRLNGALYSNESNGQFMRETLVNAAELSKRALAAWVDEVPVAGRIGSLGRALADIGNAMNAFQAIAGVRIARAVLVTARDGLQVKTTGKYRVYLGGLLAVDVPERRSSP